MKTIIKACKTVLEVVGLLLVASCSLTLAPNRHLPRPPRRNLTIEKAQHWFQRHDTPAMRNRRYYRAYPK